MLELALFAVVSSKLSLFGMVITALGVALVAWRGKRVSSTGPTLKSNTP